MCVRYSLSSFSYLLLETWLQKLNFDSDKEFSVLRSWLQLRVKQEK